VHSTDSASCFFATWCQGARVCLVMLASLFGAKPDVQKSPQGALQTAASVVLID
jgi:hypothetical protein